MNKKVLKTMIALVVIFLSALYVLKIFIPEQFVLCVEIEKLVEIGRYIDTHAWADYLFGIITSFITYWFYLCATCKRWYLKWYECLIVLLTVGGNIGLNFVDVNLYTAFSYSSFIFLPMLFGSDLDTVGLCFSVHLFSQTLTLSIRDVLIYMTNTNSLTIYLIGVESFIWLLLLYLLFNYKEKKLWVGDFHQHMENTTIEKKSRLPELIKRLLNSTKKRLSIKKKSKQEKKKTRLKIKLAIRDFIVDELWQLLLIVGAIALCSWLFNRWIEGALLVVAHIIIRRVFDKQFHFSQTAYCLILTMTIIWFAIPITLPVTTSLLSSIPIAFIICFFGFVAQDWVDVRKEVVQLNQYATELVMKLSHKDIYAMTEDELYEHCRNCGLDEEECKIAYFVVIERLQGKELYKAIPYSEATIKRKRAKIMKKINEQPKNITTIVEHH